MSSSRWPAPPGRYAFLAVVVCFAVLAGTIRATDADSGPISALLAAVAHNKVLWGCTIIALATGRGAAREPLRTREFVAAAPALTLGAFSSGVWPWLGLAACLVMWTGEPAWRGGRSLLLALALHRAATGLFADVAGDAWLKLDAVVAGALGGLLVPGLEVTGTALHVGDGPTVILVWGCSSFSQAGDILLLCWALAALGAGRSIELRPVPMACCLALLALTVAGLNAARLALMARSMGDYEYLHGPDGSALYRLALLALAALASRVCVRVASR